MVNSGYIKIHRKIIDWEWYTDSNVKSLFLHCLIKANHKKKSWQGIEIDRGSFITSYAKLALELNLSIQQIRTAIGKLKSTNEVTFKTTSKYSVISINNYDDYQEINKQVNRQITNEQQTNNNQITTTNNEKNEKNDKNKDTKHKYGQFKNVLLTDKEYNKLKKDYQNIDEIIEFFSSYIEEKGYKSKSHNLTIRRWVIKAFNEKKVGKPKYSNDREVPTPSWMDKQPKENVSKDDLQGLKETLKNDFK